VLQKTFLSNACPPSNNVPQLPFFQSDYKLALARARSLRMDIAVLVMAWYTAIQLRVDLNPWMSIQISATQVRSLVPHPVVIVVLWTVTAVWIGLCRRKQMCFAAHAIRQAIESDIIACALAIVVTFFSRPVTTSRGTR